MIILLANFFIFQNFDFWGFKEGGGLKEHKKWPTVIIFSVLCFYISGTVDYRSYQQDVFFFIFLKKCNIVNIKIIIVNIKFQKEILRCAPPSSHIWDFYFFCVHQFAYMSISLCVCGSVCNPFQVFKNSVLWGTQWLLSQKIIKTQWLTSGDWGCPLDNDPELVFV